MKKWETKNGYKIFRVSSGRSNVYLISNGNVTVMIDTAIQSNYPRLLKNIYTLGIPEQNIDLLILTHTHFDHCKNAYAIQQKFHCSILMSEKEAEFTISGYTNIPEGVFKITKIISNLGKHLGPAFFGYPPFLPDILIADEYIWKQNDFFISVISTKGHSKGSVSVIVDHEIAIVGDAMMGTYKNAIIPPFADDVKEMIQSWNKLLNTGCTLFLPGHGNAIERELVKKIYNKYAKKYNFPIHL